MKTALCYLIHRKRNSNLNICSLSSICLSLLQFGHSCRWLYFLAHSDSSLSSLQVCLMSTTQKCPQRVHQLSQSKNYTSMAGQHLSNTFSCQTNELSQRLLLVAFQSNYNTVKKQETLTRYILPS
jgi:hypothetical protein